MRDDDALCEQRAREAPAALRDYWKLEGWTPFSPEQFYVTWGGLWRYAASLLICEFLGHKWSDSGYCLSGEPSDYRDCERCNRNEVLREAQ
jgi:hypothetical protein